MGRAAARFARIDRSVETAATILDQALREIHPEWDRPPVAA
jgi:hypothetical protein